MSSDELLLTAAANLKKGIECTVNQIRNREVNPDIKLRWMRGPTRQIEALVEIAGAQNNMENKSTNNIDSSNLPALTGKEDSSNVTTTNVEPSRKECRRTI